jgi:hypothetical protein
MTTKVHFTILVLGLIFLTQAFRLDFSNEVEVEERDESLLGIPHPKPADIGGDTDLSVRDEVCIFLDSLCFLQRYTRYLRGRSHIK